MNNSTEKEAKPEKNLNKCAPPGKDLFEHPLIQFWPWYFSWSSSAFCILFWQYTLKKFSNTFSICGEIFIFWFIKPNHILPKSVFYLYSAQKHEARIEDLNSITVSRTHTDINEFKRRQSFSIGFKTTNHKWITNLWFILRWTQFHSIPVLRHKKLKTRGTLCSMLFSHLCIIVALSNISSEFGVNFISPSNFC